MNCFERYQLAYDEVEPFDLEPFTSIDAKEKNQAKNHLKEVLYWLYKSSEFDEIMFERSLEELCAFFNMQLPDDLMKRQVS